VALTEMQRAQVDKFLTAYCAKRVPAAVRSKVRVDYHVDGNAVVLYEERPSFRPPARLAADGRREVHVLFTVPLASFAWAQPASRVYRGVHGFSGRWLVNGSGRGIDVPQG
jgi:hypothetical protein